MDNIIFLNHNYLPSNEAHVSIQDRGLLLGDGIFETIRVFKGQAKFLKLHWQRLSQSANIIQIPFNLNFDELVTICENLLLKNDRTSEDSLFRLTLTRGQATRGLIVNNSNPTLLITNQLYTPELNPNYSLSIAKIKRNHTSPLANIKALSYLDNILARQAAPQYSDCLFLNLLNHVACTSIANIFVVKDNHIFTPSISDGVLPGITRKLIIDIAKQQQLKLNEKSFDLDFLLNADEVFITNSLKLIQSVHQVDQHRFNQFEMSQKLTAYLNDYLK